MTTDLGNNGNGSSGDLETTEELQLINKNLDSIMGKDGTLVRMNKQDIGLLRQLAHVPDLDDPIKVFTTMLPVADFKDDTEMLKHAKAFDEAIRLGLDLWLNVRWLLSLFAVNRNSQHSSRAAMIMDTISHQKISGNFQNYPTGKKNNGNPRSPIGI